MSASWKQGQVIANRYRLEGRLGRGATSEVWRAQDVELRSPVAIKLLDPALASGEIAARLLREARAAANLRSLHVVQILDHGLHLGSVPYITMELLEGETLAERLDRTRAPLSPADVGTVMTHVGRAVAKAHDAGIVHRDLKPPNIFLAGDEDELVVKVFDFGIAKVSSRLAQGATATTQLGTLLGTPEYMSPEQASGIAVDFRSDLWSMAIVACEAITGQLPYRSVELVELLEEIIRGPTTPPSSLGRVPEGFDAWFARATRLAPGERFPSAKAMVDALRVVIAAHPATA